MIKVIIALFLVTSLYAKPLSENIVIFSKSSKNQNHPHTKSTKSIIKTARSYLGTRYRFGGNTRKGIDCSGFTKAVMKSNKVKLPRTASQQASSGKHVDKKNLRAGDLVFFAGTYKRGISHVGIMISKDKFIHASSGAKKVTISSLNKAYYRKHYYGARRV